MRRIIQAVFIVLMLTVYGQSRESINNDSLLTVARDVIAAAKLCALVTIDSSGQARIRTMDPFAPEADMTIWLATNPKSRKVAQIRQNPNVVLYYSDISGGGYVTIKGTARIVDDKSEKNKYWKEDWQAFYPDRDESYLLIEVKPQMLEVISEKHGVLGDSVTWQPPTIYFPDSN